MLYVCIFMVVSVCSICVLLCVCKYMYVCFLGQGRTAMPTDLSLNYKSNQSSNQIMVIVLFMVQTTRFTSQILI